MARRSARAIDGNSAVPKSESRGILGCSGSDLPSFRYRGSCRHSVSIIEKETRLERVHSEHVDAQEAMPEDRSNARRMLIQADRNGQCSSNDIIDVAPVITVSASAHVRFT